MELGRLVIVNYDPKTPDQCVVSDRVPSPMIISFDLGSEPDGQTKALSDRNLLDLWLAQVKTSLHYTSFITLHAPTLRLAPVAGLQVQRESARMRTEAPRPRRRGKRTINRIRKRRRNITRTLTKSKS